MPRLVPAPVTVVSTKDVVIDEFFGNASCNPCGGDISFAHVKANAGWAEEWQAPAFDEYVDLCAPTLALALASRAASRCPARDARARARLVPLRARPARTKRSLPP